MACGFFLLCTSQCFWQEPEILKGWSFASYRERRAWISCELWDYNINLIFLLFKSYLVILWIKQLLHSTCNVWTLYCNFECESKLIHLLWLKQASPPSVRASRLSSPLHDNLTSNKKTFSKPRASLEKDVSCHFGLVEFISGYLDSSLRYFLWTLLFQLTLRWLRMTLYCFLVFLSSPQSLIWKWGKHHWITWRLYYLKRPLKWKKLIIWSWN